MTELAEQYAISRKTGYKWVARYETAGPAGLLDRSWRPQASPATVEAELVQQVVPARRRKPYWGARKLRRWLATREPPAAWPSRSTIHTILRRQGAVRQRRRLAPPHPSVRRAARAPNDVWTVDFKGHFRFISGQRCYPLILRDLASRHTLRCDALVGEQTLLTRRRFARAFAAYGLPVCIRSDNGNLFAGTGLACLSRLAVWWMRLGIDVERIALRRPDQSGAHEHFHHVLKCIPPGRRPGPSRRSRGASITFAGSTTKSGPMKPWTMRRLPVAIGARPGPCPGGCRRSSIQATVSRAGSSRSEQFGAAISPCFSPRPSRVKQSRSKQSTTGCRRCIAATSRWHVGSSGNAACLRCRLTKLLPIMWTHLLPISKDVQA